MAHNDWLLAGGDNGDTIVIMLIVKYFLLKKIRHIAGEDESNAVADCLLTLDMEPKAYDIIETWSA